MSRFDAVALQAVNSGLNVIYVLYNNKLKYKYVYFQQYNIYIFKRP